MQLAKPYLLFLGESKTLGECKTAAGLRDWCRSDVLGQYAIEGCEVDLGIPRLTPAAAAAAGARSLVIGVAPVGGRIPERWWPALRSAIDAGLDVVSGMHTRLAEVPGLEAAASARGCKLRDVRHSDRTWSAATGAKRSGLRVLTVGTDCALGKKYTALALTTALKALGLAATFRATGQTGIMISGDGIAIDAVVADFIAGAAEWLSPANAPDHWDVIEGQGALFHPAYAGVTLGLVHGSQPDALVLCHDPTRRTIDDYPDFPLPSLEAAMDQYVTAARLTNRNARFVGISLNTSQLEPLTRATLKRDVERKFNLPVIDPILDGAAALAARIVREFPAGRLP
jgi:D-glutamate N-acetyltransferase